MNLSFLRDLIAAGESLTLELKKSTAEKDRACRTLCALANGEGGHVVFGVTPAGKLVGQRVTDRTLEELAQEFQGFEPPLFPQLQRIPLIDAQDAGHEVLLVQVDRSTQAPVSFKSHSPGPRGRPWHARSFGYLARTGFAGAGGATVPRGCGAVLQRRYCLARVSAIANAFIHRDYASAAGAVAVALYDDRLEIISPGELHFGFTPEMLFQPHESKPWNPWIAKVFHRRGLIETWGRGTLKMAGLMQEAGLQPPTVAVQGDCVVLTFRLAQSLGGGSLGKTSGKTSGKIVDAVRQNSQITIPELATLLGVTPRSVERNLQKLQAENCLARVGPANGGYWKVL